MSLGEVASTYRLASWAAPAAPGAAQPLATQAPVYAPDQAAWSAQGYPPSAAPGYAYAPAPVYTPAYPSVDPYAPYVPAQPAQPAVSATSSPVFGDHNAPAAEPTPVSPAPAPVAPAPTPVAPAPAPVHRPRRGNPGAGNTFARLDRDRDGALRGAEIDRLVVGPSRYDANADQAITRREFLAGRRRDQRVRERRSGRREARNKQLRKRSARLFALADLDMDGKLRGAERGRYKGYDRNRNGMIAKSEFLRGQHADRLGSQDQRWLTGKATKGQAARLRTDRASKLKKMPKPQIRLDANRVAALLGSPVANVKKSLPGITAALNRAGLRDRASFVAMLATIRTEVGSFLPIHEYGGPGYWARYNGRSDLGNRPGTNDGVVYHGRGFIQLTGRANYGTYGRAIGMDLVHHPDRALRPGVAARVLTAYFQARGVVGRARAGDWLGVRTAVNGGTNGWDTFIGAVRKLQADGRWFRRV